MSKHLNPNHPVLQEVREQWPKLCVAVMQKMKVDTVEITPEDADAIDGMAIVVDTRNDRFILKLMSMAEAEKMAREAGGLPI